MDKNKLAQYLKIDISQLDKEISNKTSFYATDDFLEDDKVFIYLLAKIRDLNNDSLNGYKKNNYYYITYLSNKIIIEDNEGFLENFFKFLIENNLKYY